ncbi:TRAP transporter small permease [Aureimonas sp. AU4]|uniref:TRAP transporter small permease n=1 Tax=Aureimonas sp. AU4 TaxID=1638163 RepID=UPI0009E9862D|nr:TRAP transporter small permease [Aureimonas sp. AU4]
MSDPRLPQRSALGRGADLGFRLLEFTLVAILMVMIVLVFGNVVMRYGFDSGIDIAEELSRVLFVWLIFLGSVVVMRQKGHLGVDMFVTPLPRVGRWLCRLATAVLSLGCSVILAVGAWDQALLNAQNLLPMTELPTAWVYAAALVSGVGLSILILLDIIDLLTSGPNGEAAEPQVSEGIS